MSMCNTCKFDPKNGGDGWSACDTCIHNSCLKDGYEPVTNADRIRAMTDEELAHWICKRLPSCSVETCPGAELCNGTDGLSNGLVKWLQQPCEAVQPITERPDGQS